MSSPASPAKGNTCIGRAGTTGSTGSIGTPRRSSFRESFKIKADKTEDSGSRRQSVVQMELVKQKPKLAQKLLPRYIDMPQMWAEVSDTQKQ